MKDLVSHVIIYVRDFYHLKELFLKDATAMEFVTSLFKAGLRTMRACDSGQREMSVVLINRCSFKIYELFIGTNVTVRHIQVSVLLVSVRRAGLPLSTCNICSFVS